MVAKDLLTNTQDTILYVGLQIGSVFIAHLVTQRVLASQPINHITDDENDEQDNQINEKDVNYVKLLFKCAAIRAIRQCFWKIVLYKYHMGLFSYAWFAADVFTDCLSIYLSSLSFCKL